MSIWQGLTALLVIAGIGLIVFMRLMKKNPKAKIVIKGFMENKPELSRPTPEMVKQVYDEKRTMM